MVPVTRRQLSIAGLLLAGLGGAMPAIAFDPKSKAAINIDAKGAALRGHDPVAYFTVAKPTAGSTQFQSTFDGATYRFANAANKDAFDKEPAKFAPQYGGFCAYAAGKGYKADADPAAWNIVGGKLYVNYNAAVAKGWLPTAPEAIKAGDVNWPKIKDMLPK